MSISLHNQEKPICPYCGYDNPKDWIEEPYTDTECEDCGKLLRVEQMTAYNIYGIEHLRGKNYSDDEPTTNEA